MTKYYLHPHSEYYAVKLLKELSENPFKFVKSKVVIIFKDICSKGTISIPLNVLLKDQLEESYEFILWDKHEDLIGLSSLRYYKVSVDKDTI